MCVHEMMVRYPVEVNSLTCHAMTQLSAISIESVSEAPLLPLDVVESLADGIEDGENGDGGWRLMWRAVGRQRLYIHQGLDLQTDAARRNTLSFQGSPVYMKMCSERFLSGGAGAVPVPDVALTGSCNKTKCYTRRWYRRHNPAVPCCERRVILPAFPIPNRDFYEITFRLKSI